MTTELKAVDWQALSKDERIALCRRLADEAQREHLLAGSELEGNSREDLASQWRMLAAEIALSK